MSDENKKPEEEKKDSVRHNWVTDIYDKMNISVRSLDIALVVLCADILARTLYSSELPISILTTVIGVPILVYFMCKRGGAA